MRAFREVFSPAVALAGILALGGTGALWSQAPPKGENRAAAGKAYDVDTEASRVYMKVEPDGRGHEHGIVGKLASGSVTPGAAEKAGALVFDLASFEADAPEVRQYVKLEGTMSASDRRSVTRTMLGSMVLDTQQYPKATCTLASVTPLDGQAAGEPGRYRFEGRLSLHGEEQPIRFEARAERAKPEGTLRLTGQFTLRQTDYKIKPYSALFGAVKVKDELTVYGDLVLTPRAGK